MGIWKKIFWENLWSTFTLFDDKSDAPFFFFQKSFTKTVLHLICEPEAFQKLFCLRCSIPYTYLTPDTHYCNWLPVFLSSFNLCWMLFIQHPALQSSVLPISNLWVLCHINDTCKLLVVFLLLFTTTRQNLGENFCNKNKWSFGFLWPMFEIWTDTSLWLSCICLVFWWLESLDAASVDVHFSHRQDSSPYQ